MSRLQPRVPKGSGDRSGEWTSTKGGGLSAGGKSLQAREKAKAEKAAAAAKAERSAKSKANHKPVNKSKAAVAFEGEQLVIEKMLGLAMTPKQHPVDGMFKSKGKTHGIEVKSLVDTGEQKVNMKQSSIAKKLHWYAKTNKTRLPKGLRINVDFPHLHTISPDFRNGRPPTIYYRRGVGAYMQSTMTRVRNAKHLRKLLGLE